MVRASSVRAPTPDRAAKPSRSAQNRRPCDRTQGWPGKLSLEMSETVLSITKSADNQRRRKPALTLVQSAGPGPLRCGRSHDPKTTRLATGQAMSGRAGQVKHDGWDTKAKCQFFRTEDDIRCASPHEQSPCGRLIWCRMHIGAPLCLSTGVHAFLVSSKIS